MSPQLCNPALGAVDIARPQLRRQAIAIAVEQQQWVIADGFEVAVVGALLLLTMDPNLRAVHIEHDAPRRIESFGPGDQLTIERGQTGKVVSLR